MNKNVGFNLQLLDVVGKENVKLSGKQVDELIDLLEKEEVLEVESKIEKALKKENIDSKSSPDTMSSNVTPNQKKESKVKNGIAE